MGFIELQLFFWIKKNVTEREIEPRLLSNETLILTTRPTRPSLKMICTPVFYNFDVIHKSATVVVNSSMIVVVYKIQATQ